VHFFTTTLNDRHSTHDYDNRHNFYVSELAMSDKRRSMAWDELVDHLREVKLAKPTQRPSDGVSDTSSKASKHSETSRYNVTGQECTTIRNLDHNRCFVTNVHCVPSEVARVLDNCNVGNRELASVSPSVDG
jgi:hypothetical protein